MKVYHILEKLKILGLANYWRFMKATLSKTPVLNRLFRNFNDFMDYGLKNPETFWDLDLPPWGYVD